MPLSQSRGINVHIVHIVHIINCCPLLGGGNNYLVSGGCCLLKTPYLPSSFWSANHVKWIFINDECTIGGGGGVIEFLKLASPSFCTVDSSEIFGDKVM